MSRRPGRLAIAMTAAAMVLPMSAAWATPTTVTSFYDPLDLKAYTLVMDPLPGWTPGEDWIAPEGWDALTPDEQAAILDAAARAAAWDVIRFDSTNTVVLAGALTIDDGDPMAVTLRRKSSRALPSESDPWKVGLKVDLPSGNPYGITKLSLENGGDVSPIAEGLAWQLHQRAVGEGLYPAGHDPGLASWATLEVNGDNLGVYTSVEQRNKKFLTNRSLWSTSPTTWFYKADDVAYHELDLGPAPLIDPVTGETTVVHSPAYTSLCFAGISPKPTCPVPTDETLATLLPSMIDMDILITQAAVDAYTGNGDAQMTAGKNHMFLDRDIAGFKRIYFPWDLDAVLTKGGVSNIYAIGSATVKRKTTWTQSAQQQLILNHPDFRRQYNATMLRLLDGPLATAALQAFLDGVESAVGPALAEDPYASAVVGNDVSAHFASLKSWLAAREREVRSQVAANVPAPRPNYVVQAPTTLSWVAPTTSVKVGTTFTMSARLTDASGVAIQGRSVSFTLAKVTTGGTTQADGIASVTAKAPTKAGTYSVTVTFAGTAAERASTLSQTITVVR